MNTYYMHKTLEDGSTIKISLDGEETFSTTCPICGKDHDLGFDAFIDTINRGSLYDTQVYCLECSAAHQADKS